MNLGGEGSGPTHLVTDAEIIEALTGLGAVEEQEFLQNGLFKRVWRGKTKRSLGYWRDRMRKLARKGAIGRFRLKVGQRRSNLSGSQVFKHLSNKTVVYVDEDACARFLVEKLGINTEMANNVRKGVTYRLKRLLPPSLFRKLSVYPEACLEVGTSTV
jgi:hypothetical protein